MRCAAAVLPPSLEAMSESRVERRRVLIVGAGIAGLALARALRRCGVAADVVERLTEWPSGGAGLYLPGNAVRAIGSLGLGPALHEVANPIGRQRFLDHHGRLLAEIDVACFWDGVGACVALPRAALHELLREAMADVPVQAADGKPFQIDFPLASLAAGEYLIQIEAKTPSGSAQQLIGFKVGS